MKEPYVYIFGNPSCSHSDVELTTLTVNPPISNWKCNQCGRVVRQQGEVVKIVMPTIEEPEVPDFGKFGYAKMSRDGDWLYRSDYLHGEDEEVPEEFEISTEIRMAYDNFDWRRCFYEIRMDARYNMKSGVVELVGVDGVKLERHIKLAP